MIARTSFVAVFIAVSACMYAQSLWSCLRAIPGPRNVRSETVNIVVNIDHNDMDSQP